MPNPPNLKVFTSNLRGVQVSFSEFKKLIGFNGLLEDMIADLRRCVSRRHQHHDHQACQIYTCYKLSKLNSKGCLSSIHSKRFSTFFDCALLEQILIPCLTDGPPESFNNCLLVAHQISKARVDVVAGDALRREWVVWEEILEEDCDDVVSGTWSTVNIVSWFWIQLIMSLNDHEYRKIECPSP